MEMCPCAIAEQHFPKFALEASAERNALHSPRRDVRDHAERQQTGAHGSYSRSLRSARAEHVCRFCPFLVVAMEFQCALSEVPFAPLDSKKGCDEGRSQQLSTDLRICCNVLICLPHRTPCAVPALGGNRVPHGKIAG